ncbi:MAG TPA: FAD-binding protein [Trebonia sp.]|nr:FAD-binding protein [Trebonia sp.]
MTPELRTWAGTYTFKAREVVAATSVGEVQRAVAAGGRVRALGSRHSFTDLADTTGTLITVTGIDPDPVLQEAARTVTVGAGMTYGALAAWLTERGWALANMASLPHISIGGTIATGTHGSGAGNQVLSAAVAALEYVGADGELRTARRGDPGFEGMPVGLGAFGIVTRVTLDVEPSYQVRQDVYTGLSWDRALASLPEIMAAGYSVSLFTHWLSDTIQLAWIKRKLPGDGDAPDAPAQFYGARLATGPVRLADAPSDNITPIGVPGPWSQRLPHFRAETVPSNGNEIQTEFFVPFDQGAAAIEAVRRLRKRLARLLLVSEIRAIAADDLWLSGAYGRPTLALHFTWRREAGKVVALLPRLQEALEPFPVRPHWGKVWRRFSLDPAYPRLADARDLFERLDPEGRFSTERLELLGVREPRSLPPACRGRDSRFPVSLGLSSRVSVSCSVA